MRVKRVLSEGGTSNIEYALILSVLIFALIPVTRKLGREACQPLMGLGFTLLWANMGDSTDLADYNIPDAMACGGGTEGTVESGGSGRPGFDNGVSGGPSSGGSSSTNGNTPSTPLDNNTIRP